MLVELVDKIASIFPNIVNKISVRYYPYDLVNINLDLTQKNQKKVLICYLNILGINIRNLKHPAYEQMNQMLLYFINKDYCIDVCGCLDMRAFNRLKYNDYDVLIGFGSVFKSFCSIKNIKTKILYITENDPEVVKIKYDERIKYFRERHPSVSIKNSVSRNQYFDREQMELADYAIMMSSYYNAIPVMRKIEKVYLINCNILLNNDFKFNNRISLDNVRRSRCNFLWFGSLGLIHKGLDILLDVFKNFPDLNLNCYGIAEYEVPLFKKLSSTNTYNKGFVNIWSEEFIENVVQKHNFMIFPSCSEGMSTAVATCMAHGIIPIITKEAGYDPISCVIELDDYRIETIKNIIRKVDLLSDEEIYQKRKLCYEYGINNFNIQNFSNSFSCIMDDILEIE